jgi:hypothetical protein
MDDQAYAKLNRIFRAGGYPAVDDAARRDLLRLARGLLSAARSKDSCPRSFYIEGSLCNLPLRNSEFRKLVTSISLHSVSSGLQAMQPATIVRSTDPGTVSALLRTESGSPRVVPDESELPLTDRATIGRAVRKTLRTATHVFLLLVLSGSGGTRYLFAIE